MNRTRAYWLCQFGGWTLLYTVSALVTGLNSSYNVQLFINHATSIVLAVAVTHAFREFSHRVGWTDLSLWRLIPRIFGATLFLTIVFTGLADVLVYVGICEPLARSPEEYWSISRLVLSLFGGALVMVLWLVIYFGIHSFWNYRQAEVDKWKLEAQAETARLKALKLQLNPHFFFNSLNSVRALIAEDPDRAQRMVTRLARLLRTTLQVDDVKTVPLDDELSTVRTYLELEKVRFEDRLQYEIHGTDAARSRPVPFLLVQTLVENGIKHGVATKQGGGTISIEADVRNGALHLRVANPGTLTSEEGGVGLDNARERLGLLFGEDASLCVKNADPDTVEARVVLPRREPSEEYAVNPPVAEPSSA